MDLKTIGPVFAERTFDLVGKRQKLVVKIGKPKRFRGGGGFYCPFQFRGGGVNRIRYAGGVDAVQALQLAMERIGVDLRHFAPPLTWDAGMDGDLGFPTPEDRLVSPQVATALEDGMRKALKHVRSRAKALRQLTDRELSDVIYRLNDARIARIAKLRRRR
ncbi:MAG: hypothetical protein JST54_35965 [Deltaproteobacteria bacterium]|nr:hypothetical protein [Deltaproteobacteria bacterium]